MASTPMYWKIWFWSEIEWAAEVQELVPPVVSEKNLNGSEAICCIVEHAEMAGEWCCSCWTSSRHRRSSTPASPPRLIANCRAPGYDLLIRTLHLGRFSWAY